MHPRASFLLLCTEAYAAARDAQCKEDFATAVLHYDAAIRENRTHGLSYFGMGVCLAAMGSHDVAVPALRQAVALLPLYGPAMAALAVSLQLSSDSAREESLQFFSRALQLQATGDLTDILPTYGLALCHSSRCDGPPYAVRLAY